MYSSGQTLVHKTKRILARLAITEQSKGDTWFWGNDKNGTLLILENGQEVIDDLDNYTHVSDEWGRPYAKQPEKGQFVDISAKKYVISDEEMSTLRQKAIKELLSCYEKIEEEILRLMRGGKSKPKDKNYSYNDYRVERYPLCEHNISYFVGHKYQGNNYLDFTRWFLERRNAKPLYRTRGWKDKIDGRNYHFTYADKHWLSDGSCFVEIFFDNV